MVCTKIATVADVLLRPTLRRAYGGTFRIIVSVIIEVVFFILLSPIQWVSHTLQLIKLAWEAALVGALQARDDHTVPFGHAIRWLWPHTLLGVVSIGALLFRNSPRFRSCCLWRAAVALHSFRGPHGAPMAGDVLIRLGLCALPKKMCRENPARPCRAGYRPAWPCLTIFHSARCLPVAACLIWRPHAPRLVERLYAGFAEAGRSACSDVGAHVGDRVRGRFAGSVPALSLSNRSPHGERCCGSFMAATRIVIIEDCGSRACHGCGSYANRLSLILRYRQRRRAFIVAAAGSPRWDAGAVDDGSQCCLSTTLDKLVARRGTLLYQDRH